MRGRADRLREMVAIGTIDVGEAAVATGAAVSD
jgi:hypothetical protein